MSHPRPPGGRRRWLQFTLRAIFVAMAVVAVLLSWLRMQIDAAHREALAVAAIRERGGIIQNEYERAMWREDHNFYAEEEGHPKWLLGLLGDNFYSEIADVCFPPGTNDQDLALLDDLRRLQSLIARGSTATPEGRKHIWRHTQIELLDLSSTSISDEELHNLSEFTRLRTLRLLHTALTDRSLEVISRLPSLEYVDLSNTHVSNDAIERLRQAHPKLKGLSSSSDSEEDRRIAMELEQRGLYVLVFPREDDARPPRLAVAVDSVPIDDAIVDHLTTLKCLEEVDLCDTKVTRQSVDDLRAALPDARIMSPWD